MKRPNKESTAGQFEPPAFIEGIDFYFENGLMVLTGEYLRKRGYCCENNCRNCPYGFRENTGDHSKNSSNSL